MSFRSDATQHEATGYWWASAALDPACLRCGAKIDRGRVAEHDRYHERQDALERALARRSRRG